METRGCNSEGTKESVVPRYIWKVEGYTISFKKKNGCEGGEKERESIVLT